MGIEECRVKLEDLKILVTAASMGIGFEIAKRLALMGADVMICSRRRQHLEKAVEEASRSGATLLYTTCDLRSKESLEKLVRDAEEAMGRVDALVFNAGNVEKEPATLEETGYEDWIEAAKLHLVAPAYLSRLLLPGMAERGYGRIVFLSSVSIREPMSQLVLADSARAGLVQLSKIIARTYASRGITSNVILLGSFDTPGARRTISRLAEKLGVGVDELWRREVLGRIPLGRLGDFDGLACVIALFMLKIGAYLNGSVIVYDGGMLKTAV